MVDATFLRNHGQIGGDEMVGHNVALADEVHLRRLRTEKDVTRYYLSPFSSSL